MRNESYPVAHGYLYEPVVDLLKLSKAAGLLISDFQRQSRGCDVLECLHSAKRAANAHVKFTNRVRTEVPQVPFKKEVGEDVFPS